jgi:hypothetical protein
MSGKVNSLTLKWGTLKAWDFHSEKALALLNEYSEIGSCMSAAMQRDTPRQKEIICELIDEVDDPEGVFLDWDGVHVSKEDAKKYVLGYGKKAESA